MLHSPRSTAHRSPRALLVCALAATLLSLPTPATAAEKAPDLAIPTLGRAGTGLVLGVMDGIVAPVGKGVDAKVRASVANIPTRTNAKGFRDSLRAITANRQDVVVLNEVGARDLGTMRKVTRGYRAYRDPVRDLTLGGGQSMNNVVMWRHKRWNLVDAGRVKVVDDDRGYRLGEAYTWDRYLTWTVLQRVTTGAILSVASLHMPTNPEYYPEQPGRKNAQSRKRRYKLGMDRVLSVVRALAAHGPVLLGGDMNSHPDQGAWTAARKLGTLGHGYAKDGVMYLFHPAGTRITSQRRVEIASDHAALLTTIDLAGVGPTG